MTYQNDATMKEKASVLRNDQRTTLAQFAQADADQRRGRFDAHEKSTVIGSTPLPKYPQLPASSPWAGPDLVPTEPAFGVDINEMEPCGQPHELKASHASLEPSSLPSPAQATRPSSQVSSLGYEGRFSSRTYRRFYDG
jgi:hypothetical protein